MADKLKAFLADEQKFGAACKAAFDAVDTDKSGKIEMSELGALLSKMSADLQVTPPKPEEVKAVFDAIDTDKSGKIDLKEFSEVLRQLLTAIANQM